MQATPIATLFRQHLVLTWENKDCAAFLLINRWSRW